MAETSVFAKLGYLGTPTHLPLLLNKRCGAPDHSIVDLLMVMTVTSDHPKSWGNATSAEHEARLATIEYAKPRPLLGQ